MNNRVEKALNEQIHKEASSSQYYLAMASWSENNGLNGTAKFMYTHSDEERFHMLKLVKFVNERGGKAVIPSVEKPPLEFSTLKNGFSSTFEDVNSSKVINLFPYLFLNSFKSFKLSDIKNTFSNSSSSNVLKIFDKSIVGT